MKLWLSFLTLLLLSGCITLPVYESENIHIFWGDGLDMRQCEQKGMVYGSEGHWFDFWLLGNAELTEGALNQLRNQALFRGGDTILLYPATPFSNSVTMMANVYRCYL